MTIQPLLKISNEAGIVLAFARQQYDPRAPHQRIRHALRAHQRTQLLSVRVADR